MNEKKIYDLIIIGGGPGGLTAGIYAMRMALNTVLFEEMGPGGQMINSGEIENWPGTININGVELSMNFYKHAESYGLEFRNNRILKINEGPDFHRVLLDSGEELKTYSIIMGTGGTPRKLNVPGEAEYHGRGVSYCAICDGFFFKNKTVAVIGGGDAAVEEALYLSKIVSKIYLIHRRDELRAGAILKKRVMKENKIKIIWNTIITGILGDENGSINRIDTKNTISGKQESIDLQGVFIFAGFEPNSTLAPKKVETENRYIITDEKCETTVPGIYAVGDVRKKFARQIITAAADGATAALAASHYIENKKKSVEL